MKESISQEQIEQAFKDCYWGECFYARLNQLLSEDATVFSAAYNVAHTLLTNKFPLGKVCPGYYYNKKRMIDLLQERGFQISCSPYRKEKWTDAIKGGCFFTIQPRPRGFFAAAGGWTSPGSYTIGKMEEVADWMDAIAVQYKSIVDYVRSQYIIEVKKTIVDKLICTSIQGILPPEIKCEVWHIRYMQNIEINERILCLLKNGETIFEINIKDETTPSVIIELLHRDKDYESAITGKTA